MCQYQYAIDSYLSKTIQILKIGVTVYEQCKKSAVVVWIVTFGMELHTGGCSVELSAV